MKIAFYGSSLLSCYWNGAATYYRGLLRALAGLGYDITFYEPDVYERRQHRDIEPPDWCRVIVYDGTIEALRDVARLAAEADIVIKTSGVGYEDDALLRHVLDAARPDALTAFWDVDAPATLAELRANPRHPLRDDLLRVHAVFTYGGGQPVVDGYATFGVDRCYPIYNALDPDTHHPVAPDARFSADLAFLGNRLPDREARVDAFFFEPARLRPNLRFLLGGAGWDDKLMPANVRYVGHVSTRDHNAFNASPKAVVNINRASMAQNGFSPATRVFEAAGAGACLITDDWPGIDLFLGRDEVLVARDGREVVDWLDALSDERAAEIGRMARRRMLRDHTYAQRAEEVHRIFRMVQSTRTTEVAG